MSMIGRFIKATVKTALVPVAIVADTVMIIPDSCDVNCPDHPLSRTAKLLGSACNDVGKIADEKDVI